MEIGCESVAPMGLNDGGRDALDTGVPRFALHRLPMLRSALRASSMSAAIEASSMSATIETHQDSMGFIHGGGD